MSQTIKATTAELESLFTFAHQSEYFKEALECAYNHYAKNREPKIFRPLYYVVRKKYAETFNILVDIQPQQRDQFALMMVRHFRNVRDEQLSTAAIPVTVSLLIDYIESSMPLSQRRDEILNAYMHNEYRDKKFFHPLYYLAVTVYNKNRPDGVGRIEPSMNDCEIFVTLQTE